MNSKTEMRNTLEQRQLLSKCIYTIRPNSLRYEIDRIGRSQSFDISFEHLYKTLLLDRTSKVEHLFLAVMLIGLSGAFYFQAVATAFWLPLVLFAAGTGLVAYYFLGATPYLKVKITGNRYVVLRKNTPDSDAVKVFLEQLFEARDAYLIEEYGQINTRLTYEYQLEQFKRLRRLQVWSKRQFREQKQQLESIHRLLDLGFDINKKTIQN